MKKIARIIGGFFVMALVSVGFDVRAQTTNQNMMGSAMRLETWTDRFKDSLDGSFDNSRSDGTETEDEVLALVRGFEYVTDRFTERVEDN